MASIVIIESVAGYRTSITAGMFALTATCLLSVSMVIVMLTQVSTRVLTPIDQNVTIIKKTNQQWPIKGAISLDGCRHLPCFGI